MANVYYDPAKFGLEIVAELDADLSYEFDMVIVWRDRAGDLWAAADSGCSCPTPFEDVGYPGDMVAVRSEADVAPLVAAMYSKPPAGEVLDFSRKVREALAHAE